MWKENLRLKIKLTLVILLIPLVLIAQPSSLLPLESTRAPMRSILSTPTGLCTSFCLDNGDYCIYGTNQDNTLEMGLLVVNKRHVLKTTWDPNTSEEFARWISRYGSVTVNFVGYQMAWAGMNEAGLMISTMSLLETRGPTPDGRPPFETPFWMQYQLDNHSTIDEVIASDAEIRPTEFAVDHYLVCDRTGACATLEFLEGVLVSHTGKSLPVMALTNSMYQDSVNAWVASRLGGSQPEDNSLWRFTKVAERLEAFEPSKSDEAVAYAFDTLAAASRQDTVWSFVYDPVNLRVHFRTNHHPLIRYLNFSSLDFSCRTPVMLLDVHADVTGDISDELTAYNHSASIAHSTRFFSQYEGLKISPFIVDTVLWGLESFPCQDDDDITIRADLVRYRPLLPPTVSWAGLTILHRVGLIWILLTVLSLVLLIWRMGLDQSASLGQRLVWVLSIILLGPCALLAYLLIRRKKRRVAKVA